MPNDNVAADRPAGTTDRPSGRVSSRPQGRRIEDYALIGNTETAALVGRDGSVDWLCLPRFDSPACFAALLGTPDNGQWKIAPRNAPRAVRRRYLDGTLVLETVFETETGSVSVTDFMPLPRHGAVDLVRTVTGLEGEVAMRFEACFRFDYGRVVPWVRRTEDGLRAVAGPDQVRLRTPLKLEAEGLDSVANFTIRKGESVPSVLTWHLSYDPPPPVRNIKGLLDETVAWWRKWSSRCKAPEEWREPVTRSAITLKALTHQRTGGIVAAPTTSLPEFIGGVRNWDYRYCWLRDATFTLYALMVTGYDEEALAWREWLVRAVAGEPSKLQIMYGLGGERRLDELELPWLGGFEGSLPVRIGNAAHQQLQLDVYGEVMDALHSARKHELEWGDEGWRVQLEMMRYLEDHWRDPDAGIWEERAPPQRYVFSAVMSWVAADRAVKAVEQFGFKGPADRWRAMRETIHREVCEQGFNVRRNAFTRHIGGTTLDASVLLLPEVGFLPPDDPRIVSTIEAIQRDLMVNGFVQRYHTHENDDGLPPGEGAFLACTLWLADALALIGRHDEARALFERVLAVRNDVGLLAEEFDPVARRQLGNFPQAFSHVGVINTARNLSSRKGPARERAES
jgi:GH15 family glucan-1,4-alpha-glucosidase